MQHSPRTAYKAPEARLEALSTHVRGWMWHLCDAWMHPVGAGCPPPAHLPSRVKHKPLWSEPCAFSVSHREARAELPALPGEAEVLMRPGVTASESNTGTSSSGSTYSARRPRSRAPSAARPPTLCLHNNLCS